MHILYIHQYFATPASASGTRSYEFAKNWVAKGHRVTMLTSTTNLPEDYISKHAIKKGGIEFDCEGISVIALDVKYDNKMGSFQRLNSFLKFSLKALLVATKIKGVDVTFATSTPLTVAIPALWIKFARRIPYVFEVRDLWPHDLIQDEVIKNPLFVKLALWFEKYIYKHSSYIVGLSPAMKKHIDNVTNCPEKTVSVPNCSDIDRFVPVTAEEKQKIKEEMGWKGKFIVGYTGALGLCNGIDRIVEYAKKLQDYPAIHFVIIGRGSQEDMVAGLINNYSLHNIELLGVMPKDRLCKIIPAMDIGLSSVYRKKNSEVNSANKFFDYLASGIPVIVNHGGWQEETLRNANAGFGAPGFDDGLIVQKILQLYKSPQLCSELGKNARRLAEREFPRHLLSDRVLHQIEKCYQDRYGH